MRTNCKHQGRLRDGIVLTRELELVKMKRRSKRTTTIYVTELDYHRLSRLIERNGADRECLNKLEAELDRAEIVDPKFNIGTALPPDVRRGCAAPSEFPKSVGLRPWLSAPEKIFCFYS